MHIKKKSVCFVRIICLNQAALYASFTSDQSALYASFALCKAPAEAQIQLILSHLSSISLQFSNPIQGLQFPSTIEAGFPGVVIPRSELQIPVRNHYIEHIAYVRDVHHF